MNPAEQSVRVDPEMLTWAEICARYPDQFVCLVDVVPVELRSPEIRTARVVGYGPTRRIAFDPIRNTREYSRWSMVFTGASTKPLRRPSLILDDEARKFFFVGASWSSSKRRSRGHSDRPSDGSCSTPVPRRRR